MPLPSPATKANCDASTDDPKLALLTDLSGLVDTVNALITAIGAEYAPLASPTLTGNPTAPTQALRNSTTRLANTAFVLANLPLSGVLNKSAAYTLLAADFNKLVNATANTWNLGIDPALGTGIICGVRNSGSGVITLVPVTGTIDNAASVDIGPGESCLVDSEGTNLLTVGRDNGIGVNQSYQPTTPNPLVLGVTYYNTFGRPVDLNVAGAATSPTGGYLNITFNGGSPIRIAGGYTPSGGVAYACIVTVPVGSYFVLSGSGMTITDSNFLR